MRTALVALDVIREAAARRFVLAIGVLVTLALGGLALGMKAEVVDGALAATRLFGNKLAGHTPQEILRPLFEAASYTLYYLGLPFGILATADLAPRLLAPGRVEHLLALPIQRWELLSGTLLGVLVLASAGSLYGALGLVTILFVKTGYLNLGPLAAALLAGVGFTAIYAAMLAIATLVRSAAASAGVGFLLFVLGIVAGYRKELDKFFEAGWSRELFNALLTPLPKLSTLAEVAAGVAGGSPVLAARLVASVLGTLGFALAVLLLAIARFSRKDC
jgi:Cu-processing system permease protein